MDSVNNLAFAQPAAPITKVYASDLLDILNHYSKTIKILSLDCFDTLIWRKTATPIDLFYDLQHSPAFKSHDLTAVLREQAEAKARQQSFLKKGTTEVKLNDIYLAHTPTLNDEQLKKLADVELTAEIEACYAFPPMVELIRAAHEKNIQIVIVSNTYLEKDQLHKLLSHALPSDVIPMISAIFCSCEAGMAKGAGLFSQVLKTLNISPGRVLHIGDNPFADLASPQALGINAVQLLQFNEDVTQMMRMHAIAGPFIDPTIRNTRSLSHLFRGLLSANTQANNLSENTVGYAAIGPILYSFGRYICDEIEGLRRQGKQPKVLFLMRDAYLPSLITEAITGSEMGKRVHISRFAAFAASFRSVQDVDLYLADRIKSLYFSDMCKQLLLPEKIATELLEKIAKSNNPIETFKQFIYQPNTLQLIFTASKNYCVRLMHHLKCEIGLKPNDTLIFIDLGYTGTAQNKLAPVFKDEMNVDVIGRYLLVLRTPQWQTTRRGLLDPAFYDDKTLSMLVTYIALLEQVCTSPDASSVIDYSADGSPVYSESSIKKQQHCQLKKIQAECIRFAEDAEAFFQSHPTFLNEDSLRETAATHLCRLIFLPTKQELDFFQDFQFDFNLGTNEIVPIFDLNKGSTALKKRSWLHSARENLKNMRTNYPAEWRAISLELALTLMSQHRFGLEMSLNDLSHRREKLQILVIQENNISPLILEAMPTHDGYFALLIPVINEDCRLAIQFGLRYQWVELESAELIPLSVLYTTKEFEHAEDMVTNLMVDQMLDKGGGLFECTADTSLLLFNPPRMTVHVQRVLRIIFRPVVPRPS